MPSIPLGEIIITPAAKDKVQENELNEMLRRHSSGDWGALSLPDREANARELKTGMNVKSAYHTADGTTICVRTRIDGEATLVALPCDFPEGYFFLPHSQ